MKESSHGVVKSTLGGGTVTRAVPDVAASDLDITLFPSAALNTSFTMREENRAAIRKRFRPATRDPK